MIKFLADIDKNKIDSLLTTSRQLKALRDLISTIESIDGDYSELDISDINMENIVSNIYTLEEKKLDIIESIRIEQGWPEELLKKIHFMENYKAYLEE